MADWALNFRKEYGGCTSSTKHLLSAVHEATGLTLPCRMNLWSERYWIGYCLKGQHSWLLHAHAYASGFLPLIPFHHNPLPNKVRWEGLPVWTREFFQWHQTRRLKAVESSLHTRLAAHGWTELIHYSEGKNVGFDWTLKESAAIPEESDLLFCFTEHKEQAEFLTA